MSGAFDLGVFGDVARALAKVGVAAGAVASTFSHSVLRAVQEEQRGLIALGYCAPDERVERGVTVRGADGMVYAHPLTILEIRFGGDPLRHVCEVETFFVERAHRELDELATGMRACGGQDGG